MKQFRKNNKRKIFCKWLTIFTLVMAAFFVYQKFLGDAYEFQIISWIGCLQETKNERILFLSPDEKSYKAGSKIMKDAGYEETGKKYLRDNIQTNGRLFFFTVVLFLCASGTILEIYADKKRCKKIDLYIEEETVRNTSQIQKEKEFIQREKDKMGAYMENLSHQLKTPLTGTMLCLDNLLSVEDDLIKKEKQQCCIDQLGRINEMTVVLLRLAQIDAGKIWLKRKRENLSLLLENCVERISLFAEEKNIAIQTAIEKECILSCDAFWIKESIENVLKNAVEFTPVNGIIRVSLRQDKTFYEIRTFNSGKTLDQAQQEQIFERFYRLDDRQKIGFGIGLSLSREILHLHQGTLRVLDTDENGTTFQFLLPKMVAKDHSK